MTKGVRMQKEDAERMFVAAERYESRHDFRNAFRCLLRAAEMGHSNSMVNLGNMLSSGTGVQRNAAKAAFWYKKAYRAGSAIAARNYAIDLAAAGNTRLAIIWLKKAIAMRDGASHVVLARIYANRRRNKSDAVALLKCVHRLGSDEASELDREQAIDLLEELQGTHSGHAQGDTYH